MTFLDAVEPRLLDPWGWAVFPATTTLEFRHFDSLPDRSHHHLLHAAGRFNFATHFKALASGFFLPYRHDPEARGSCLSLPASSVSRFPSTVFTTASSNPCVTSTLNSVASKAGRPPASAIPTSAQVGFRAARMCSFWRPVACAGSAPAAVSRDDPHHHPHSFIANWCAPFIRMWSIRLGFLPTDRSGQ